MEVCDKCKKPISTSEFKDRRKPFSPSDITVTVAVSKCLCLECIMAAVRTIICDYDASKGEFCKPEKETFKFQSVRYG